MTAHQTRRCAGCGKRAAKAELLRFVRLQGVNGWIDVRFDKEQRGQGRGLYLHPNLPCCSKLAERRVWERALRLEGQGVPDEIFKRASDEAREEILKQSASLEEEPRAKPKIRLPGLKKF